MEPQQPRYVALEHRSAQGSHCDFLMERQGRLAAWRIGSLEELTAGGAVLAEKLPDHRLDYLDYEGPVSNGRGAVRALARGSLAELQWSDELIRVELVGDLSGVLTAGKLGETLWQFILSRSGEHEGNQG